MRITNSHQQEQEIILYMICSSNFGVQHASSWAEAGAGIWPPEHRRRGVAFKLRTRTTTATHGSAGWHHEAVCTSTFRDSSRAFLQHIGCKLLLIQVPRKRKRVLAWRPIELGVGMQPDPAWMTTTFDPGSTCWYSTR